MKTQLLRMPRAGTPRSTPLLLALASLAALAANALAPDLARGASTAPIAALEAWPVFAAATLGIGVRLAISRALGGGLAVAMTLSLLLAASAALLQTTIVTGTAAAISAASSVVFLASALLALDVALIRFAPARALRS
jgi:hypothetical protein